MNLRSLVAVVLLAGVPPAAGAAEIVSAGVERTGERYEVDFAVILEGDRERVWEIITDYVRFAAVSPTVASSRVVSGRPGGDARVEVVLRPCVLVIFCKTIKKTSDADIDSEAFRLEYVAVPGLSDFHAARETITLHDETRNDSPRVRFVYAAVLEPKFFVPPFVGPWLIRRAITQDLETSSRRVEDMVQQKAAGD